MSREGYPLNPLTEPLNPVTPLSTTPRSILKDGRSGSPLFRSKSVVIKSSPETPTYQQKLLVHHPEADNAQTPDNVSVNSDDSLDTVVPEWSGWRNACRYHVLKNPWFERIWLLVIITNCVVLAVEDPTDHDCVTSLCGFTTTASDVFTLLFTVECAIKISGLGFYGPRGAYLKDEWNILDFVIVVSGVATFTVELVADSSDSAALTALRAFRLLRPLKAIQAFPAVRVLVQSIIASLPQLADVFVLYFFVVLTMGIISVQQWNGLFHHRCVMRDPTNTVPLVDRLEGDGERICKNGTWQLGGHLCPWNYDCLDVGTNPYSGKLSFNNIGVAVLTLFVSISLEGWSENMYSTIDATTWLAVVYWIFLIVFGSFFVMNLTIVVITEAFEKKQQEQITAAFFAIDKDGTGELDRDEVRALLEKKHGRDVSDDELEAIFEVMDEDGGGTVSLGEFLAYSEGHAPTLTTKKSSVAGLGGDLRSLAARMPMYEELKGVHDTVTGLFAKATAPREKRTRPQEIVYQLVKEEPSKLPKANSGFRRLILLCILLNTLSLAITFYGQPKLMTQILDASNIGFTAVFGLEALLKLFGMGVNLYFSDNFNTFDFVIVLASLFDLLFASAKVSVLRSLRVLRVLKLAKALPTLQRWVLIVISSIKGAALLTALLGLVVFIVALIGMQLFGGQFCFLGEDWDPDAWYVTPAMRVRGPGCGGRPRANYDSLGDAILTTFQILTGEDWNVIMYTGMVAAGDWVCVYFVAYYVLGNYLMLNLFIAVLLNNRELKDQGAGSDATNASDTDAEPEGSPEGNPAAGGSKRGELDTDSLDGASNWASPPPVLASMCSSPAVSPASAFAQGYQFPAGEGGERLPPDTARAMGKTRRAMPGFLRKYADRDFALFFMPQDHGLRYWVYRLVASWGFETVIFVCILASTIFLALEDPLMAPDHSTAQLLELLNFIFIWIFLAEAICKTIGYGFILYPSSYLRRESWNRLDFFIVCVSLLSLLPGGGGFAFVKMLRVLRPLRLINKSPGMKVVVRALFTSIKPLLNVLLISFVAWMIFGIMGVQVFAGTFYRCSDEVFGDVEQAYPNITSKYLCENFCPVTRCRWMNYGSHFDHLVAAMVTLFEMASLEGWVSVMYLGMDITEPEFSPQYNHSRFWAIYFLAFVVFGSFFIINMFIGVLIDTYYQEKEKAALTGGQMFLNESQRKWINEYKKMMQAMHEADDPSSLIKRPEFGFVTSSWFEWTITVCILLNVITMAVEHHDSPQEFNDALEVLNVIFITIFALEAVLKLVAMGFRNYWTQLWNRFDLSIVVLSTAGLVMSMFLSGSSVVSVFRILRLARLLRMVKRAKGIKRILNTLMLSFVSLVNVAGLLFLLLFVFATLGVKLFGQVKRGPNMNYYANFESFRNAILLLLRMSTGEGWQAIQKDLRTQPPDCDSQLGECGLPVVAIVYSCTYTMAGMYVLMNLFIAVILDNFSESAENDDKETVTVEYIDLIQAAWDARSTAVDGENVLTGATFQDFLREIGPPLGPSTNATTRQVQHFIVSLDVNYDADGYLHKESTILKMFKKVFGERLPPEMEQKLDEQFSKSVGRGAVVTSAEKGSSLSQQMASVRVQAMMKSWLARRKVLRIKEELQRPVVSPSATYVCSVVPEDVQQVRVALPNDEEWFSSFHAEHPLAPPDARKPWNRAAVAALLQNYHDDWDHCTHEQKEYYRRNHSRVFSDQQPSTPSLAPPKTPAKDRTFVL
ncbi:Muscle calcium channel subunit alpha-1 [Diplonema papillatum]|nr:Muscle calcium channel subunit alpha-1 [Diplonema papillatum]|eukprot:gene12145-18774_t